MSTEPGAGQLEKALKTKIPTDVQKEAADEQKVPGVGTLQNFDPHKPDQLPKLPGVYVFYDVSDRPVYIGKADNIAARVKNHEEKKWGSSGNRVGVFGNFRALGACM